jgi:hypothetical protein
MYLKIKTDSKNSLTSTGEREMDKKKYSDSNLKPDKTCHYKKEDMGTVAKKAKLPGQMYVPKKDHNESDFAGEQR